ncbi:UbiA-like protein EboC [Cellulophaga sp. F20128]|uniref:UbiA-like protein EboC n=1 Tax=Cellulophaga sp. F20128 TaxID=2926413 RepID=UPI001FF690DC|nr:UbiA-like protein EboC [Cellulophaga sp. F20128]MCK0156925.1 UbiA-like protein EboC [Cellulophaga sp. F20128]
MNAVLKGYLSLMRPANLPTAAADIFAGMAIAGVFADFSSSNFGFLFTQDPLMLIVSSVMLYAGGVVLNDVFDFELDKIERPERAIPSGLIPLKSAAIFGSILLLTGIVSAYTVSNLSGSIAVILTIFILSYDYYAKHKLVLGPINMGICRGLNLLLGISILGTVHSLEFTIIPVIYIAAITLISKGEVHGDNKSHIVFAGVLYALVLGLIAGFVFFKTENILQTLPFLALLAFLIFRPLRNAYKVNSPQNIKKAVMGGVLSLIILDATIAVGFSHFFMGILIILLLPLSMFLSRLFAVT